MKFRSLLSKSILYYLLGMSTVAAAADLTITPNTTTATLVTTGIPFAPCEITSTNNFKLVNESGTEVQIFIKPTLYWPTSKCAGASSIRAVKVQFQYNPAQGQKVYSWTHDTRSLSALTEAPVSEFVTTNPTRSPYKEPAFFAVSDPEYLVTTGLIPPTTAKGDNDYDNVWFPQNFALRMQQVNLNPAGRDDHLFDPVSTIYQQALRTGNIGYYREAYLEHEFYMKQWIVVPQVDAERDIWYVGTWGLAAGDIKFSYLTPIKLHLALTGDDTWVPSENGTPSYLVSDRETFLKYLAYRASSINGIGFAYTNIASRFTEREAGFGMQSLIAAYELTLDPTILTDLNNAIDRIYNMMTANPDGRNNPYLSHSWEMHEGFFPAYLGKGPANATGPINSLTLTAPIGTDYTKIPTGTGIGFYLDNVNWGVLSGPPVKNLDGTLTLNFSNTVNLAGNSTARFGEAPGRLWTPAMNFEVDRVFSTWMQSIMADALWQAYNLLDDNTRKTKIAVMLRNFGRSLTAYGVDGKGMPSSIKTKIENAFGVKVQTGEANGSRGIVPYTRYVASTAMGVDGSADYINYINVDGSYSDMHSPESIFQISLAIMFETDPAKKEAMEALVDALVHWFSATNTGLTIQPHYPVRKFNWENKPNPWGTFELLGRDIVVTPPPENPPPGGENPPPPPPPPPPGVTLTPITGSVWSDDAVPTGATAQGAEDGWTWVTSSPAPYSGTQAHKSIHKTGFHQHYFEFATSVVPLVAGDVLATFVYLDPAEVPTQIMLQFQDGNGSWEHRAYWGPNTIGTVLSGFGTDGTVSHRYIGDMPTAGQWVKLQVPVESVGLVGHTLRGQAYSAYNGIVSWDLSGKEPLGLSTPPPPEEEDPDVDDLLVQILALQNQLASVTTSLNAANTAVTALEGEKVSLTNQLTTSQAAVATANTTITNKNTEISTLTANNTTLTANNTVLNSSVTALNSQISTLQAQLAAAIAALEAGEAPLPEEIEELYEQLQLATTLVDNQATQISGLAAELVSLSSQVSNAEGTQAQYEAQLAELLEAIQTALEVLQEANNN